MYSLINHHTSSPALRGTHISHARPHAHSLVAAPTTTTAAATTAATARYDKYHLFISRLSGVAFLTLLYMLNTVELATAVPIAVAYACIIACFGPIYAELKLETKPAHKAAFLMAPLIVTGLLSL